MATQVVAHHDRGNELFKPVADVEVGFKVTNPFQTSKIFPSLLAKKSKCDGKPRCNNCAKRNEVCEYASV